jgi:hypothetical protein
MSGNKKNYKSNKSNKDNGSNNDTNILLSSVNKENALDKSAECFNEMLSEYKSESIRLAKEAKLLVDKEEEEFIKAVYENGIAVRIGQHKLTMLDKSTNKIVDVSGNRGKV